MTPRSPQQAGLAAAMADRIAASLAAGGADPGRRKATGAIYTPAALSRLVVERSLAALGRSPDLVLDPACGTGHFLVAAWEAIRQDWRGGPPPVSRLCGIELDGVAAEQAREVLEACAELDRLELGARKAKPRVLTGDALTAALDDLDGKCDLAIGNPPYVRIDRLEPAYRAELVGKYGRWLAGKWDLYYCFLARTLDFLSPGGVLGFVTPNQYFLGRSALLLRARLAEATKVHEVVDLCGLEPFDRAIPPAAVTVLAKQEPRPEHQVRLEVCLPGREGSFEHALQDSVKGEVAQDRWRSGAWSVLAPEPFRRWLDRLDAPRLGDLAPAISEGDTRRAEEALLARAADAPADWWPVVRGGDVAASGVRLAPGADRLPPGDERRGGRILVRDVAPRLTAALDPGRTRCLRTVYCAYPADPALSGRLASLLNTDLLTWIYVRLFYSSKMSPRAANFRFQSQYLAALPIVLPPACSGEAEALATELDAWALEAYGVAAGERDGIEPLLRRLGALRPAAGG